MLMCAIIKPESSCNEWVLVEEIPMAKKLLFWLVVVTLILLSIFSIESEALRYRTVKIFPLEQPGVGCVVLFALPFCHLIDSFLR